MKNKLILFLLLLPISIWAQSTDTLPLYSHIRGSIFDTMDITKYSSYIPAEKVLLTTKIVSVVILELSNKDKQVFLEDYGYYLMRIKTSGSQEIHWIGDVGTQIILNNSLALKAKEGDIYRCREQPNGEKCCEVWRDGKGSPCY